MDTAKFNVWAVSKNPAKLTMFQGGNLAGKSSAEWLEHSRKGLSMEDGFENAAQVGAIQTAIGQVMSGSLPREEIEVRWNGAWHKVSAE